MIVLSLLNPPDQHQVTRSRCVAEDDCELERIEESLAGTDFLFFFFFGGVTSPEKPGETVVQLAFKMDIMDIYACGVRGLNYINPCRLSFNTNS